MWQKLFRKIINLFRFLFGIKISSKKRISHKKYDKGIYYLTLDKSSLNPIISPQAENSWEAWQTFNPGTILIDGKIHFIYRAIGEDGMSRFGYACSNDGYHINVREPYPIYQHRIDEERPYMYLYSSGGSFGGCEDPRIVRVDKENIIYMMYVVVANGKSKMAITSIKISNFLNHRWEWKQPVFMSLPNIVGKNWILFPKKIKGKYVIIHSINPEILLEYLDDLDFKANKIRSRDSYDDNIRDGWDSWVRGIGPPPIETKYGWLIFYHAIDKNDSGKYKVGAMILDINNPTKILYRAKNPIMEPDKDYENNGFKPGIVYVSGVVVKNGELLVYYGGSDNYVCVAHANLNEFLDELIKSSSSKFNFKNIVRKK